MITIKYSKAYTSGVDGCGASRPTWVVERQDGPAGTVTVQLES